MASNRGELEINFDNLSEYTAIMNSRLSNYKAVLGDVIKSIDNIYWNLSSEDRGAIEVDEYKLNILNIYDKIGSLIDIQNIRLYDEIINAYIGKSQLFSQTFLDPSMIYDAIEDGNKNNGSNSTIEDIYKVKKLNFVSIDGEIVSNFDQDEINEIQNKIDNTPTEIEMTKEQLEKMIDELGLTQEEKDAILKATVTTTFFANEQQLLDSIGIKIKPLKNGKVSICGANKVVEKYFGKNIRRANSSTLVAREWANTLENGKLNWKFKGDAIDKLNSAMLYLNLINNVDDARIHWKVSGDGFESAVGLGVDVTLTLTSGYVVGATTTAVVATFAITSTGGTILVAIGAGLVVSTIITCAATPIKDGIIDTIDGIADFFNNIDDFSIAY